jgi:hypothetical protein
MIKVSIDFARYIFITDSTNGRLYSLSENMYNACIVPLKRLYGSLDKFPESYYVFARELKFNEEADQYEVTDNRVKIRLNNVYSPAVWLT